MASLARFKKIFYLEKRHSFLEKNLLQMVHQLPIAVFFSQKLHYSTSSCMVSMSNTIEIIPLEGEKCRCSSEIMGEQKALFLDKINKKITAPLQLMHF
jgi:hypothetical protein